MRCGALPWASWLAKKVGILNLWSVIKTRVRVGAWRLGRGKAEREMGRKMGRTKAESELGREMGRKLGHKLGRKMERELGAQDGAWHAKRTPTLVVYCKKYT